MAASTSVTTRIRNHRLFMRSLESSSAVIKYMSLSICAYRQGIAKTGANIAAITMPVANAFILCRITGISVSMFHITSDIKVTGMTDMMATINAVGMITEATIVEMAIGAIKVMTVEMVIVK
jgi:hypothetical protein